MNVELSRGRSKSSNQGSDTVKRPLPIDTKAESDKN